MTDSYESNAPARRRGRDRGQTLVEVLVSIVLLGTTVGGTLTALRTTIISSKIDESRARAETSLRAAEDALHRAPYVDCVDVSMVDIMGDYDDAVGAATLPVGWAADVIQVWMWGRDGAAVEKWMDTCAAGSDSAQLVTIIVTGPNGANSKSIQVVKRD